MGQHYVKLCHTDPSYRKAWEEGRGPGQDIPSTVTARTPAAKSHKKGVGDHMKDVTRELRLNMKPGCNCQELLFEMNRLGPGGCRRERSRLVEALKENAKKYTWVDVGTAIANASKNAVVSAVHLQRPWIPNPLDPYGSMLDEAIRRTETVSEIKQETNVVGDVEPMGGEKPHAASGVDGYEDATKDQHGFGNSPEQRAVVPGFVSQ
jgi:hypothetical protein